MLCGHGMPRDFARAVISRCWRQEGTTRPRRRRGAERTEWTGWTGWTNGADRTDRTDWVRGWWGEICCGLGVAIRWCRVAQPPAGGRHPCGMRRREGWLCDGARREIRAPDQLCVRQMCGWGVGCWARVWQVPRCAGRGGDPDGVLWYGVGNRGYRERVAACPGTGRPYGTGACSRRLHWRSQAGRLCNFGGARRRG